MVIRRMFILSGIMFSVLATAAAAFAAEKTVVFHVSGLECARNEVALGTAVRAVSGVADVAADSTDQTAVVKFDDAQTGPDAIIKAIEADGGFKVNKFVETPAN